MFEKVVRSSFLKSVILVASGTAGAQVINLLASPIITRMYGPDAFGLLGTFIAFLGVLTPIAALSYPLAIVLPSSDREAKRLASLSIVISILISVLLFSVFLLLEESIFLIIDMQGLKKYLFLIPFVVFFIALQQVFQQWLIRKSEFKVTAKISVIQSLILNLTKIGSGLFYPVGAVLIALSAFGNALYAFQLWVGVCKVEKKNEQLDIVPSKEEISYKKLAWKYRDFAYYRTPQLIINAFSQSLPILILAMFYGPAVAGFFTLGRSVLAAPAGLIGNSVGSVFYPRIAQAINRNVDPLPLVKKATYYLFFIALIPFSIIIFWGQFIFELFFGEDWGVAGNYAQWMAVWVLFGLSARPLNAAIPALRMQKLYLLHEIVFFILKVLSLLLSSVFYQDAIYAVIFYSMTTVLSYIVLYVIFWVRFSCYV